MKTILVQFADARWTKEAVIQACILARNSQARVVVLRLMPVPHASYLGTDFGFLPATPRECRQLDEYRATAEDYGVDLTIEAIQSVSSREALVQAARALAADLLFAYVPPSWAPYWHRFQVWRLHEALGSMLITLDQPISVPRDEPLTIEMITHPPLAGSLPPVR